jgi:hypothetical protein
MPGSSSSFTGSPVPRQRPFGPGNVARYPASYPAPLAEEPATVVPVSCCLSATGLCSSGHPVPARELGLRYGRLTGRAAPGPGRGFHVPHQRATTGMGASSTPGTAVLSWPDAVPGQESACRFLAASPCHRAPTTHREAPQLRVSTEVHAIHPSGLPLACGLPDGTKDPRAFPCAPHPAVTGSARQGGAGR